MKRRPVISSVIETSADVKTRVEKLPAVETDGTVVKYSDGLTISGKFQSVVFSYGIELPTMRNKIDSAFAEAEAIIDERCANKHTEAKCILRELVKDKEAKYGDR